MCKIKFLLTLLVLSLNSYAVSDCKKRLPELLKEYSYNKMPVKSYEVKKCHTIVADLELVGELHYDTNAPKFSSSSACVVLLDLGRERLDQMYVFDNENDFELKRSFDRPKKEGFMSRKSGGTKGQLSFSKNEGKIKKLDEGLSKIERVTRAVYDLKQDKVRLLKWKIGWFSTKYSHDYTLKCN